MTTNIHEETVRFCRGCGYNMQGHPLDASICPECGRNPDKTRSPGLKTVAIGMLIAIGLTFCIWPIPYRFLESYSNPTYHRFLPDIKHDYQIILTGFNGLSFKSRAGAIFGLPCGDTHPSGVAAWSLCRWFLVLTMSGILGYTLQWGNPLVPLSSLRDQVIHALYYMRWAPLIDLICLVIDQLLIIRKFSRISSDDYPFLKLLCPPCGMNPTFLEQFGWASANLALSATGVVFFVFALRIARKILPFRSLAIHMGFAFLFVTCLLPIITVIMVGWWRN